MNLYSDSMYEQDRTKSYDMTPGYDVNSMRYNHDRPSARERSPRYRSNRDENDIKERVYDDYVANDYRSSRRYDNSRSDLEHDDYRVRRHRDRRYSRSRSRSRDRSSQNSRDSSRNRRGYQADSRERRGRNEDVDDYPRRRSERDNFRRDDEYTRYANNGSYDDYERHDVQSTSTIIVQNLGPEATECKIEDHLRLAGVKASNVQVIRDRITNTGKGFAFVEFADVSTAEKWIQITKRNIVIDGRSAQLDFSRSKRTTEQPVQNKLADWNCLECNALNFGSRKRSGYPVTCFKCGVEQKDIDATNQQQSYDASKYDKDKSGGVLIKLEPCNVLMLRGMSFSTTEEQIRVAVGNLTSHPIYDVRLIRDKVTDMSRGFAFVELGSSEHAKELLETIENANPPFEIEMRKITVGYARHGYNAPLHQQTGRDDAGLHKETVASNAVAQATAAQGITEYSQSVADTTYSTADTTNSEYSEYYASQSQHNETHANTYDPATGYYYDASTGLYYDPNTGYYYNGNTGQFLYWNGSRYQAVNQDGTPVTSSGQQQQQNDVTNPSLDQTNQEERVNVTVQKPKNARKIAKDMERWAKKMNSATEARKMAVKQAQDELKALEQKEEELRKMIVQEKQLTGVLGQVANSKDGIRSLFVPDNDDEGSVLKLGSALVTPTNKPKSGNLVAADLPDDDDDFVDETKFVDTVKMACLLCKRQFPNKDVLTKHLQVSQLHQTNLAKFKKTKQL